MIYTNIKDLFIYIRQQMLADDVTMTELGNRMNKSQAAVSQMFRRDNITLEGLKEVCHALGYDLEVNLIKQKQD